MMKRMMTVMFALLLGAMLSTAHAEPVLLGFVEQAQKTVAPDAVEVSLRYEARGKTPVEVQAQLNEQVGKLAAGLRKQGIAYATGAYAVRQEYAKERPADWVGTQQVTLRGKDSAPLLEAAGVWQERGFILGGVSFSISKGLRQQVRRELIAEAVEAVQATAAATAAALGLRVGAIERLSLDTPALPVRYMSADSNMRMATMAAPVAEPGELTVEINLQAEVRLE